MFSFKFNIFIYIFIFIYIIYIHLYFYLYFQYFSFIKVACRFTENIAIEYENSCVILAVFLTITC